MPPPFDHTTLAKRAPSWGALGHHWECVLPFKNACCGMWQMAYQTATCLGITCFLRAMLMQAAELQGRAEQMSTDSPPDQSAGQGQSSKHRVVKKGKKGQDQAPGMSVVPEGKDGQGVMWEVCRASACCTCSPCLGKKSIPWILAGSPPFPCRSAIAPCARSEMLHPR